MLVGLSCRSSDDAIEHHWVILYAGAVMVVVVAAAAAVDGMVGFGWENNSDRMLG